LVGLDNERMPLRSRLLQVPELREKYLERVRYIAEEQLDPEKFAKRVEHYRQLIQPAIEQDTRKLSTTEAFVNATASGEKPAEGSLRHFAAERSKYLKEYKAPAKPAQEAKEGEN
jgi:hypothetical protein